MRPFHLVTLSAPWDQKNDCETDLSQMARSCFTEPSLSFR